MIIKVFGKNKTKKAIYSCDECRKIVEINYLSLVSRKRLDSQYCRSCSTKISNEDRKKTWLEKYGTDNPMKVSSIVEIRINKNQHIYEDQRVDFDHIKESFKDNGYRLLTTEYINNKQKLNYICPNGHERNISWNSWSKGRRCKICSSRKQADTRKHNLGFIRNELEEEGYKLLSTEYLNKYAPIKYECPRGHIGSISFGNWLSRDTRCSSCSHIESNTEIEIREFLSEYVEVEANNRKIIKPLELDIVVPLKKIAIEFCGLYFHSEISGNKDKWYHLNKLNLCKSKGYTLITIFEDEWLHKKEIVKSRLKSILNISGSDIVYARNCEIREIKANIANEFLNNNHLQGSGSSNIRIGAFYNDNLVSTMTFCRPNISHGGNPSDDSYELNRFCSLINTQVVGIASRLLKYFINQYNPKLIFSYADKRWSTGNLYYKLGFKHIHDSQPNYWYVVSDRRVHRFNFRKSQLKKMDNYNLLLSEWEIMKNNDHDRIWDCGNIKFVLDEKDI